MGKNDYKTVSFDEKNLAVVIVDQTLLPREKKYVALDDIESVREAICSLRVRGAPAIGVAAAFGLFAHMKRSPGENYADRREIFERAKSRLSTARPTAVNLDWALGSMAAVFESNINGGLETLLGALYEAAMEIQSDDVDSCRRIGEYGSALINGGSGVLTHCNAGALATSMYGTALAPMYLAHERGVAFRAYADETRPLLQGARLTAYELTEAGIDVTLICDNMVASVMDRGWVDAVFVGCDRVASNGDAANKIGTCGVAIVAASYGIPFYVCAPYSTIDTKTATGSDIKIEERDPYEVTGLWYDRQIAPAGVKVYNPAFDVTPARYITAFITERGIVRPPYNFLHESQNLG